MENDLLDARYPNPYIIRRICTNLASFVSMHKIDLISITLYCKTTLWVMSVKMMILFSVIWMKFLRLYGIQVFLWMILKGKSGHIAIKGPKYKQFFLTWPWIEVKWRIWDLNFYVTCIMIITFTKKILV